MDKYQESTYYSEPTVTDGKSNVTVVYQALGGSIHVDNYRVHSEYAQTHAPRFSKVIASNAATELLYTLRENGAVPVNGPDNMPAQSTIILGGHNQDPNFMMVRYENNKSYIFHGGTEMDHSKTDITLKNSASVAQQVMHQYTSRQQNAYQHTMKHTL